MITIFLVAALLSVRHAAAAPWPPLVRPRAVTFASLDVPALRAAVLPYDPQGLQLTWSQTSSCCGYGPFTAEAVSAASAAHGLFEASAPCGWTGMPAVGEWGYEFLNNGGDIFPLCGNLTSAAYAAPPANRSDALARMAAYWVCRAAAARAAGNVSADAPVFSMIGHYLFAGLSAAIEGPGRIIPGSEIGENINSVQLHLAATRGAARQSGGAPFAIDFSAWLDGFITDFSTLKPWGAASSPVGGHSLELLRRSYFATFFAGASGLIVEAGAVNAFLQRNDSEGVLEVSPLGDVVAELFAFTHPPAGGAEAARGIPYVPVALVMEQAHGMGLGWFYSGKAWDVFPLSDAEERISNHLAALWPGSFTVERQIGTAASESGYLVPSPLGDLVDVLLPANLSAALLTAAYRAVVVAGLGAPLDAALAAELTAYVASGGTVLLSADEAAAAAAAGWLPASLLGLTLAPEPPAVLQVLAVTDVQTGWSAAAAAAAAPFCSPQSADAADGSPSWFMKTGGDPTVRSGWDGGHVDKCCSTDAAACLWFSSAAACDAALPLRAVLCRECPASPAPNDVGCPAWQGGNGTGLAVATAAATLTTAQPLLVFNTTMGSALAATVNIAAGGGRLVLLLAPGAEAGAALGITQHLLTRLRDDTTPVALVSNVSTDAGAGVQLQLARTPWGWLCALYNNNGVTKQPNATAIVDATAGRAVTLTLLPAAGAALASAWEQDGARTPRAPLAIADGRSVTVDIEPGGLRIVGLLLAAGAPSSSGATDAQPAAPARVCLDPPAQAACLSWSTDGTNISFVGSWPALPSPYGVGWGAWGISSVSCGSMYPASVWMAIKGPSGVVLEDRFTDSHAVPQCRKRQLSYVTASSVKPDGSFTVSWTRPLVAPPSSGQPDIVPGNVSLIGAAYFGEPLDLRPCEPSGIPAHTSVGAFTVQLVEAPARRHNALPATATAAAGSGLIAAVPVCVSGVGASNNFARVSPRGVEQFYGASDLPGYLGISAVDAAGRRMHSLFPNSSGVGYALSSVDIDTGRLVSTCDTGILVPTSNSFEDAGLAWDARGASLILAACTDSVCAGYVQVSRLQPGSCQLAPVVKVPTDPAAAASPGAAAFDAASNTFVMSITQTIRGVTGLVLVAVDMGAGSVAHVYNEARRDLDVAALVPEAGAPAGVFVGAANFLDATQYALSFVRYDAVGNTLTRAPALPGCSGALPGSGALDPLSGIFYFITQDAHGTRVLGVHTANGTLASAGTLPGDSGQTPSAFFYA